MIRNKHVTIRFSKDEVLDIERMAKNCCRSKSDYIRNNVLHGKENVSEKDSILLMALKIRTLYLICGYYLILNDDHYFPAKIDDLPIDESVYDIIPITEGSTHTVIDTFEVVEDYLLVFYCNGERFVFKKNGLPKNYDVASFDCETRLIYFFSKDQELIRVVRASLG